MKFLFLFLFTIVFSSQAFAEGAVKGFADLHNHMLAEYAYGGAWFHGSHTGHEHEAMKSCSGNADFLMKPKDHARTIFSGLNELIGKVPGSDGDTGWHYGKRHGFPEYSGWPRWDTIAHQQVWEGNLKQAHLSGLSLMNVSAVNFKPLCLLMPSYQRKYSCDDMKSVDLQIQALHKFVQKNQSWVALALSPAHAREIIASGKLALILSIEVSDLFEKMDWRVALNHYYAQGVRSLQLVHQLNNRFGGAAIHNDLFKVFQFLRSVKNFDIKRLGFQTDHNGHNILGLTNEGKELVRELIKKNILIDLAHLSENGIKDVAEIIHEVGPYPLYISHGHFRDIMEKPFSKYEKSTPDWILNLLKETGGMMGLRTGSEATKSFGSVPNDCDGSTKSFAQAYEFGMSKGVPVAFGSDLNGFIQQLRPRFGNDKESCGASGDKKKRKSQQRAQSNPIHKSFDHSGFGHIGQIGDIITELQSFGVDTSVIENSSEIFIQMWEKAHPAQKDFPMLRMPASVETKSAL